MLSLLLKEVADRCLCNNNLVDVFGGQVHLTEKRNISHDVHEIRPLAASVNCQAVIATSPPLFPL